MARLGRVAFRVLYEPSTSMSITDLKALGLNWLIGARKFPAAPALYIVNICLFIFAHMKYTTSVEASDGLAHIT